MRIACFFLKKTAGSWFAVFVHEKFGMKFVIIIPCKFGFFLEKKSLTFGIFYGIILLR